MSRRTAGGAKADSLRWLWRPERELRLARQPRVYARADLSGRSVYGER